MEKAYKYRIYPNKKQKELILKTFGCTRYVYNYFLNLKQKEYKNNKNNINFSETSRILTVLKKENQWLKEPDKCALQNSLKDLDTAYQNFFKLHKGYPKFKSKKDNHKSYRTSFMKTTTGGNIKYLRNKIVLPKLGAVKIKDKQVPQGRILNATISQDPDGRYYCSLTCTDVKVELFKTTGKNVGIDLGIVDFAIFSDGVKIENKMFYEKSLKKLTKLNKELSRKQRGSANCNKARIKITKLYKHITNQRNDFLQKLTTQIVKEYDIIAIEDLKVNEMNKTNNSIRNRRLSDVSWYQFRRKLTYKCKWYGKELVVVNQYFPSTQICNVCGCKDGRKEESIREWTCPACGSHLDRDINASINILNEGLRLLNVA